MENSQINPTAEMDNALSTPCPSPECGCPSCYAEYAEYTIDLTAGFYSSMPYAPGPKPTERSYDLYDVDTGEVRATEFHTADEIASRNNVLRTNGESYRWVPTPDHTEED